jgi:site-specific recombinase XerD
MVDDEVRGLLELPAKTFFEVRNKLIFEFLYSTGCRVGEMVPLNIGDVNLKEGLVKVTGKGRKERIVYFGHHAGALFLDYLSKRTAFISSLPAVKEHSAALFLNKNGGRLTARGVRVILDRTIVRMGMGKRISPHTFRHTFATHVLNRGADIRVVQELLGHASLSTTQVYTHLGVERLKNIYAHAHPHAKMGKGGVPNKEGK